MCSVPRGNQGPIQALPVVPKTLSLLLLFPFASKATSCRSAAELELSEVLVMTQAGWLKWQGMPVSIKRKLVRREGRRWLRCLRRPRVRGTRCGFCWREREQENKKRKR